MVLLGAAVVVLATSGCLRAPQTSQTAPPHVALDRQVSALRDDVDCSGDVAWHGDPYFWDEMRGMDCSAEGGRPVFIRAYRHGESVPQVLQDWTGTFVEDRVLLHGEGWFVIGPKSAVSRVAATHHGRGPTTELPRAEPLSGEREERTTCVRFLSGTVQDAVHDQDQFVSELPAMDRLYPGAERVIRSITTPGALADLAAVPEAQLASRLGDFADELNKTCAASIVGQESSR